MGLFSRGLGFLLPFMEQGVDLSDSAPSPEATSPAAGGAMQASRSDHQHQRLTSSHAGLVLGGGGTLAVTFTRTFALMPAITIIPTNVSSGAVAPPILVVQSYTTANSLYTGCVVRGFQGQAVTVAILGVGVNAFAGNAAGVEFSLVALQQS